MIKKDCVYIGVCKNYDYVCEYYKEVIRSCAYCKKYKTERRKHRRFNLWGNILAI